MKRVHLKTAVRREQIALAALDIVMKNGVRAMTVEAVARNVGLTPSALYRHYSGKMALLTAVVELLKERLRQKLAPAVRDDCEPLQNLYNILLLLTEMVGEMQALPRILFSDEMVLGDDADRTAALGAHGIVTSLVQELLQKGVEQGSIRADIEPVAVARMFMGIHISGAVSYHASGGRFDMQAYVKEGWKVFAKGLTPA